MLKRLIFFMLTVGMTAAANGQAMYFSTSRVADSTRVAAEVQSGFEAAARKARTDSTASAIARAVAEWNFFVVPDSVPEEGIFADFNLPYDTLMLDRPLPKVYFLPAVYTTYEFPDTLSPFTPDYSGRPEMRWIETSLAQKRAFNRIRDDVFYNRPDVVQYNLAMLPEAPKAFHAVVNPEDHTIKFEEMPKESKPKAPTIGGTVVEKKHWIRAFNVGLQFSQAYVSPNWYQGGNSNLNMIGNLRYDVKLNQAYHPNLKFETTFQYNVGVNNAPDDSIHNYNISQDVFQINTTFGVKAARSWYYSFTGRLKTQLLNTYPANSRKMRSAFMSPGELNLGVGMTYNYTSPKKTFVFDASISPVSYNLVTCISHEIDPGRFGIKEGRRSKSEYGSSTELKLSWRLCYNITYTSRMFAFTDYDAFQCDWNHKIVFDINRFLSTQINADLRYDTTTPRCEDPSWHKLQLKEILSIGFSYKFASI